MIRLQDLLHFSQEDMERTKIKFNQWGNGVWPLDTFVRNPEEVNTLNLFWRTTQRYFSVGQLAINFVQMTSDTWLLTTIKEVTEELGVTHGQNYNGTELSYYSSYYGRLVVRYKKGTRLTALWYRNIWEELEIVQLLPEVYGGEAFPGYDNVSLSYQQLETILRIEKRDWLTALTNQKAVYLITDRHNGKHYVGSATSEYGMLLSRWSSYVDNGHGGNKELRQLVDKEGLDYVKQHFQYTILENYNAKVDDHYILGRESWWKEALQSRQFGYNAN